MGRACDRYYVKLCTSFGGKNLSRIYHFKDPGIDRNMNI